MERFQGPETETEIRAPLETQPVFTVCFLSPLVPDTPFPVWVFDFPAFLFRVPFALAVLRGFRFRFLFPSLLSAGGNQNGREHQTGER